MSNTHRVLVHPLGSWLIWFWSWSLQLNQQIIINIQVCQENDHLRMLWSPTLWPPTYVVIFFPQLKRKTPEIFGRYQFAGMEGGKPYYQKTPASTPPTFLFWLPTEKQWMVGPTKGNKSGGVFSSVKNSLAVCPGDPPASGNWQRKSSFLGRWKKEATLSMTCDTTPWSVFRRWIAKIKWQKIVIGPNVFSSC